MQRFEKFIETILHVKSKKRWVLLITLGAFLAALAMFPTKIVLAKMLPGKSTNTFSLYIDLPNGSSYRENQKVNQCVVGILQQEKDVENIEIGKCYRATITECVGNQLVAAITAVA